MATKEEEPAVIGDEHPGRLERAVAVASEVRDIPHRSRIGRRLVDARREVPVAAGGGGEASLLSAQHDSLVIRSGDGTKVVRWATTPRGVDALTAQIVVLDELRRDARLDPARRLLPHTVDAADDLSWTSETACPGRPGAALGAERRPAAAEEGLHTLHALHQVTAESTIVDDAWLDQWVRGPARVVERAVHGQRALRGLARVTGLLVDRLAGRQVVIGRLHGDPSMDNILFDQKGSAVTGLVDWESSHLGLPAVDTVLLLLSERRRRRGGEIGRHVVDLVRHGFDDEEAALLDRVGVDVPDDVGVDAMVLLAWLHHCAANLLKSGRYHRSGWWLRNNVTQPLVALRRHLPAVEAGATSRRSLVASVVPLVAAVVLWCADLRGEDPAAMTDLGLLSLLGVPAALALACVLFAFVRELAQPEPSTPRLAAPLVAFVVLVHGTPGVFYGTLRYSWAWKHLGIIDFISRTETVDPQQPALDVYHSWPGFFSQMAAVLELTGASNPSSLVRWWPVLVQLALIWLLAVTFGAFGLDRRVRWTAVAVTVVSNWVGQDYFSPQSEAYVMYLAVLAIVLRRFPGRRREARFEAGMAPAAPWSAAWCVALVAGLGAAIVMSHQVTPFMLLVALAGLCLFGRVRCGWAFWLVLAETLVWAFTGARTYLGEHVGGLMESFGQPSANTDENLIDTTLLSGHQQLVAQMGRLLVVVLVLLAAAGVLRQLVGRRLRTEALLLAAAPVGLVVANDFDGEIIFRTYLFALPFVAWFAADLVWGGARSLGAADGASRRRRVIRAGVTGLMCAVLLAGFVFGYYGKDQWFYFSHPEVAASRYVLEDARPGSILVTASTNYPGQFTRYENLTYVPIASEPLASQEEILSNPADKLAGWLSEDRPGGGYVLLTRSQADEIDATALMEPGSVERIWEALAASPRFEAVVSTPEAVVFVLAEAGEAEPG